MCIAILNTKGTLDFDLFEICWQSNPHGGGIAYVASDGVKVIKEMKSVEKFYQLYSEIRLGNNDPMIIHFRFATSGLVDQANCHPFEVYPGLVMVHNGILNHVNPTTKVSDTRIFNDVILSRLPRDFVFNEGIRHLISVFIEDSKLIFLNKFGLYTIINEHLGHWDEDQKNWYSNYSYLELDDFNFGFNNRNKRLCRNNDIRRQLGYCESCGNYVDLLKMEYSHEFNVNLCNTCYEWYQKTGG